jgi:hypothetical protein
MYNKQLKSEVVELLNQVLIKVQDVKTPTSPVRWVSVLQLLESPEDYLEGEALEQFSKLSTDEKEDIEARVYLAELRNVIQTAVDSTAASLQRDQEDYYSSNC